MLLKKVSPEKINFKDLYFSGIHSGIKQNKKLDMGLIYSSKPLSAEGLFTTNTLISPSVALTKKRVAYGKIKAVLANSGNANAMTGPKGRKDAQTITKHLSKKLNIKEKETLFLSTGIIGKPLDINKFIYNFDSLINSKNTRFTEFAKSILTTDKTVKLIAYKLKAGKQDINILGIAKGSGMIKPELATFFAFIISDAKISKNQAKSILKESVDSSFNRISVDNETSTNDAVLFLRTDEKPITSKKYIDAYKKAVNKVCFDLAMMILADGEGVTKTVKVNVTGAQTKPHAKKIAYAIGNSLLVKTAIFGNDPNWGRIASSAGAVGINYIKEDKISISINKINLYNKGKLNKNARIKLLKIMNKENNIEIDFKIFKGNKNYTYYTTDLSYEYVKINAAYT